MFYRFDGKQPVVGAGSYVSETAIIVGDVRIGEDCYIGHGAILRGDYGIIEIGNEAAIEEGVIIHAPPQEFCNIGFGVAIGHGATVHAGMIGNYAGIGMGAVLSVRSEVGARAIVAEGAVVKQNQHVPEGIVVAGNPAAFLREVSPKDKELWAYTRKIYLDLAHKYVTIGMERIELP